MKCRRVREFASLPFRPPYQDGKTGRYEPFRVSVKLRSQDDGATEIEFGVGVAVIVEKTTPGVLDVPAGGPHSQGLIRIDDVALNFQP